MTSPTHLTIALMVTVATGVTVQGQPVRLRIVFPEEGAYVSGTVTLRAAIEPPTAAADVVRLTLFADGRQVCALERPPFECTWDAGERVREHVVRGVAVLTSGERPAHNVRTKGLDYAETVNVDLVQVSAVVTEANGRFVSGLAKNEFRVFEDNVQQQVTFFGTADRVPLEVVAAIDVSGSMTDAMPSVKGAVKGFLSALAPQDQVTLLAFNDNLFTLARKSVDPAARLKAVDRLAPWGGTALYDVILKGLELVGRQQGRRAIVVFTDGHDENSFASLEAVIKRVEASDATMYMIGQGEAVTNPVFQRLLQRVATVSGGRAFATDSPQRLETAFADIIADLSNQYLLAYPPKNPGRDETWHEIRVEVKGGQYKVRARQGYRTIRR